MADALVLGASDRKVVVVRIHSFQYATIPIAGQ